MQENFLNYDYDFSNEQVSCPLSGGINSMAVLIWLASLPKEYYPSKVYIFYAHFIEHSPDTFKFVKDGIRYAYKKFGKENVLVKITKNSVNKFFIDNKWIPHPTISPCSSELKFKPLEEWLEFNDVSIDLIGYVREEKKRIKRQRKELEKMKSSKNANNIQKIYSIAHLSNADCFSLVKQEIGWYPAIYDIKENEKQVFTHNNCLPCKNMSANQLKLVEKYYPEKWKKAKEVEEKTGSYWGRLPVINKCDYCLFD